MTVAEFWNKLTVGGLAGWAVMVIILIFSLVQIAPVRLNPWDRIFEWLGKKMNGDVKEEMKELRKEVRDLWINSHRQNILTFARECRGGCEHSAEEWGNILNICEEYEKFCDRNEVVNGIVRENTLYIRNLYQELSREHRI